MDEKNIKKRRCSNCGAFLNLNEKVCYVCGEVQLPEVVASERTAKDTVQKPSYSFKEHEDFVTRGESHSGTKVENIPDYDDELAEPYYEEAGSRQKRDIDFDGEMADPYYEKAEQSERSTNYDDKIAQPYFEGDKRRKAAEKRRTRRIAIVCVILILIAAIAAGTVCFCYYNGFFGGGKNQSGKVTIYFDRPSADIDLIAKDGTVYHWTGDVEVSYSVNGKGKTKDCNPDPTHNTLWKVVLPDKAKSVYFYQSTDKVLRTQVTPSFTDNTVYYVAQDSFNVQNQLSLGECSRESFSDIGVNYATIETTEPPTTEEATAESETSQSEETTAPTEATFSPMAGTDYYDCVKPDSWNESVIAIEKNNCVTYYDKYNYNNYGMGMLASIYVFDADDPEANSFDKVDKVFESSDKTKKIVVVRPSDIQYNDADEEAITKYIDSNKETKSFIATITGK